MRALVTGGAGFIGSHLVRLLLKQGVNVRVLDNFSSGHRTNLPLSHPRLQVLEGDIRNLQMVQQAVQETDFIFHLAAFVSVPKSLEAPLTCLDVNVNGTATLLEAARRSGVRRVVLASSAAVYGDAAELPLREETPPRPRSPYATSKLVNELYADLYTQMGLEVVALRFFNVYGPRQNPNSDYAAAIPRFISRLLNGDEIVIFGDGNQTRDLIYVEDVAYALWLAAERPNVAGRLFNICTGRETRLLEVVETLYRLLSPQRPHRFAAPRPGDIYRSVGNPQRAASELGFRAAVSLEEGLRQTVEAFRLGLPI
ncbi:MAG: SDR family oxidoreductase [Anaerolineales bacterium]